MLSVVTGLAQITLEWKITSGAVTNKKIENDGRYYT